MDKPIIEIKGIGKKYNITHQQGGYVTLRDVLAGVFKNPFNFAKQAIGLETKEEFWALRNVNLEINRGEIVGIIGHNGAGKSTLLKILTGITPPTEGEIIMRGRVASLLEVGTGFHPELTGRENIFLNGAIIGMTKKEIARKFDEIVAFAGVEKFLDTPVKYYSSGMYVRLAFSVAAHMEPDILLVDEVLAVGDAEFQKKCIGKMEDIVRKTGRTIFFVSHNMGAIEQLCKKTLVLNHGQITFFGNTEEAIKKYFNLNVEETTHSEWLLTSEYQNLKNKWFSPTKLAIVNNLKERTSGPLTRATEAYLEINGDVGELDSSLTIGYAIYTENNETLYWTYQTDTNKVLWPKIKEGQNRLYCKLPLEILNEGIYRIELIGGLHNREWLFEPNHNAPSIFLTVKGSLSESPFWTTKRPGLLAPIIKWKN